MGNGMRGSERTQGYARRADVAVLDYSSLRFDWLITEKPVLFFVPAMTLAGIPPLSGFFSKEPIIAAARAAGPKMRRRQ